MAGYRPGVTVWCRLLFVVCCVSCMIPPVCDRLVVSVVCCVLRVAFLADSDRLSRLASRCASFGMVYNASN